MDSKRNRLDVDRISSLPDDVLCHILSFLSTKYSVRTRVLSTRWNHLYASVPVLDFDYTLTDVDNGESFLKFVEIVMLIHNYQRLTKFRLDYDGGSFQKTNFTTWVSSVVHRSVEEIDIRFSSYSSPRLPCCLFSCKTLAILKLDGKYDFHIPGSACLPFLKTLILRNVDEGVQTLFSICPVLEFLSLVNITAFRGPVFNITIATLKRLRMDNLRCRSMLLLKVPSLESFDFVCSWANKISGETLTSLVKAFICPSSKCPYSEVGNLVTMVCNAQHLYLSRITTRPVFSKLTKGYLDKRKLLLTFQMLTRLELGCFTSFRACIVLFLLTLLMRSSTNLVVLVFTEGFEDHESAGTFKLFQTAVRAYVSPYLKEVQFRRFRMIPVENLLVNHFLVNARLDKMIIEPHLSWQKRDEMKNMIQNFENSGACQIVIE